MDAAKIVDFLMIPSFSWSRFLKAFWRSEYELCLDGD